VQPRAQNEVAVKQRAGFAEKCKKVFAHPGSACASHAGDGALAIADFFWLATFMRAAMTEEFRRGR
jgi:hypothetical protein